MSFGFMIIIKRIIFKYKHFISVSFIKYFLGSLLKGFLTLFMLWFLIDIIKVDHRNIFRIIIFIVVALIGHYFYKYIGYAK